MVLHLHPKGLLSEIGDRTVGDEEVGQLRHRGVYDSGHDHHELIQG